MSIDQVEPGKIFHSYELEGPITIRGSALRRYMPGMLQCAWWYDVNMPPSLTPAEYLSSEEIRCHPKEAPVAKTDDPNETVVVRVQVQISESRATESGRDENNRLL